MPRTLPTALLRPLLALLGVLVAVAVGIGVAGGWAESPQVEDSQAPLVQPGEAVDVGPAVVAVTSWGVVPTMDYGLDTPAMVATLAVHATITTTANAATGLPSHLVRPLDLAGDGWVSAVRTRDLSRFGSLTPGVAEDVILTLPVLDPEELAALGDVDLEVALVAYEYAPHGFSRELGWWERDPVARVVLPRDQDVLADYVAELEESA